MIELITRLIQPVVQIKRKEWPKALSMFFYFGCTIATLYILKPIRSSIFITSQGADQLRYAYIGEGAFLLFFTFFYIHFSARFSNRQHLFSVATLFFITNVIGFWALFHFGIHVQWLAFLFYIWVAAYSITIVTQFWTLANDIFDPREAKRLFGFILSGGSLGGVAGGLVTNQMAERIGTENLLLLVAGLLLVSLTMIFMVTHSEIRKTGPGPAKRTPKSDDIARLQDKSTWKIFFGSRYLLLIVALVIVSKLVSTLIDNQFNAVVERSVLEKNARTAFFGGFMAWLNALSFLLQLVVASFFLRRFGVAVSLLLLPVGLGLGSIGTLFMPGLLASIALRTYDGSMNYSIGQLGKEILYIPIPSAVRYRVKPIIDMLGFRLSKSVAGIFIIFMTSLLGISDDKLGIVVLFIVPIWVMIVWGVRDEYMQAIRKLISEPEEKVQVTASVPQHVQEVIAQLNEGPACEKLRPFLHHSSSIARKIAATGCFFSDSAENSNGANNQMIRHLAEYESLGLKTLDFDALSEEGFFKAEGLFGTHLSAWMKAHQQMKRDLKSMLLKEESVWLPILSECLNDPKEDLRNKRIAVLMLVLLGTQGALDILLQQLSLIHDRSLRFNIIRAIDRIKGSGEHREIAPWILKKEIAREAEDARLTQHLLHALPYSGHSAAESKPPQLILLEALREESLERLFRLLSVLYSRDIILVIHKRLVDYRAASSFKAHALELLENVVEPKLAKMVALVFEEDGLESESKGIPVLIREAVGREDLWFSICGSFLIFSLKLKNLYPAVSKLKHAPFLALRETANMLESKLS